MLLPEPARLLAGGHELVLLPPAGEGGAVLHVLEEVRLLHGQILVHDLEELAVGEDVGGADLHRHARQLVHGGLALVVVQAAARGHPPPHRLANAHKHALHHAHPVVSQRAVLNIFS